jgi:hypothetical protein
MREWLAFCRTGGLAHLGFDKRDKFKLAVAALEPIGAIAS